MSSAALAGKTRPTGSQWRHGVTKMLLDNIYSNMDAAFLALEQAVNAGWASCAAVHATGENTDFAAGAPTPIDTSVDATVGMRILVTNQTLKKNNGIYVVETVGSGANGKWVRADDLNSLDQVQLGDEVWVTGGTTYAHSAWRATELPSVWATTGDLVFSQMFSAVGAGGITEGMIGALAVTEGKLGALSVTAGKIGALAVTTAKIDDLAVTAGKIAANAVTTAKLATVADGAVTGGTPVLFRKTLAGGAGNTDIVVTPKIRVVDAWFVLKGAGGGAASVALKNGTDTIVIAIDVSAGQDKQTFRAPGIDDAFHEIAAGGTLRFAAADAAFPGAEAYVLAVIIP